MEQEITISHKPGPFVFIMRDKDGTPLYVGGTQNIDRKSFNYRFQYSYITGYYYDFPDFEDEIDRAICSHKALYNKCLNAAITTKGVHKLAKEFLAKYGIPYRRTERGVVNRLLMDYEQLIFRNEIYYVSTDVNELIIDLAIEFNVSD